MALKHNACVTSLSYSACGIFAVIGQPTRIVAIQASIYRDKTENLIEAMNSSDTVSEAARAIRNLIEAVRLVPADGQLKLELYGELASLLSLGMDKKTNSRRQRIRRCK